MPVLSNSVTANELVMGSLISFVCDWHKFNLCSFGEVEIQIMYISSFHASGITYGEIRCGL